MAIGIVGTMAVMKKRNSLYAYLLCALFAAITAICSQIMIPLPFTPVPINLALLAVWVCGGVLGARRGAISVLVYILLGAIGVPVFHGLQSGIGVLAGPTGGYIAGFLPAVIIYGLLHRRFVSNQKKEKGKPAKTIGRFALAAITGLPALAACYALGTLWFAFITKTGLLPALLMCVVPFIPGDIMKLIAAAAICKALPSTWY